MTDQRSGAEPEHAAVEALWRESSAHLRAWFARRCASPSDAEDLLQETFLRVHQRLESLLDARSVRAWVGTIARNVLHDHLRKQRPVSTPDPQVFPGPTAKDEHGLDATVACWLEDFLRELDPEDAEALRLADLAGHTQGELALRLGLSLSGAKSRVQRARARLRARLEACCALAFDARGGILSAEKRRPGACAGEGCE